MKILLTGSTGFIGAAFVRLALRHEHQIAGLVVPGEAIPAGLPANQNLVWIRGTLEEAPWGEIAAFSPDVCLHTAWITTPGVYLESPENYRFLESSLKFLRKVQELGTKHIIGLGTCIEYQISDKPLSEDSTPVVPATTYARCKNELRFALEADSRAHGLTCCWSRVFYPYGPREHPSRLCSSVISKLRRNEEIVLKTPKSTKDYIYIDDLTAAILLLVEKRFAGTVNLGTGIGTTVYQLAQTLEQMLGKRGLVRTAVPELTDPLGYVVADNSRLRSLGWQPKFDLARGLETMLNLR